MRISSGVMACALVLGGCSDDPRAAVETHPASVAVSSPVVTQIVAEAPAIMVAQIGSRVDAHGLLQEPQTQLQANAPIHGLAIFKGMENQEGEVALQIFDGSDRLRFSDNVRYSVRGETKVGFKAKSAEQNWNSGNYRALYSCNGKPCWEIKFVLQ